APAAAPTAGTSVISRTSGIEEIRRLHEQEKWAESRPWVNRVIAEQPPTSEAFALRSHANSHLERHSEALADGEQSVRLGPNLAGAHRRRGEAEGGENQEA